MTAKNLCNNSYTLIASVDISKDAHKGYYRLPDGSDIKPFTFANTIAGYQQFCRCLEKAREGHGLQKIVVGFESTGCYAIPFAHYMSGQKGIQLVQINPTHTKRVKEVQDNSPGKTDDKDPKVIADIMQLGRSLSVIIPTGPAAELRQLSLARERVITRRTALYNQLHSQMFVLFPEFECCLSNLKSRTARYVMAHFTTPAALAVLKPADLAVILKKQSRGRYGANQADKLGELARHSVGIHEGQESLVIEVRALLTSIDECDRLVDNLEGRMKAYVDQIPYSKYMLSMKGIGIVTVAALIGEVGDFRQFHVQPEILKLAGLNLFEISSGKHKGRHRISKHGRPLLRKTLYFAALTVIRKGGVLHDTYQGYLKRGMTKNKAVIAIARKLIGILFALVRDEKNFITNYTPESSKPKAN